MKVISFLVNKPYTLPQLFKDLLEAATLVCGTVRSNRKGFPVALEENVDCSDSLFHKVNMGEGFMMAVHWKDKRDVYALFCLISQSLSVSKQIPGWC